VGVTTRVDVGLLLALLLVLVDAGFEVADVDVVERKEEDKLIDDGVEGVDEDVVLDEVVEGALDVEELELVNNEDIVVVVLEIDVLGDQ
jgi:hypothetical protein